MAVKFLDLTGLQKFWTKCKNAFVAKDTSGNVSVVGTLGVSSKLTAKSVESTEGVIVKGGKYLTFYNANNDKFEAINCNSSGKLVIGTSAIATVADVTSAVADAGHLKREIKTGLPGVATAVENVIYMIPKTNGKDSDGYYEYMKINGAWEKVGSSDVDLTNYPTKLEVTSEISTAISNAHTAITETEINNLT